jgi:hypothetical protein
MSLFLVGNSIIYAVLFMILLASNYEHHSHHLNDPHSYKLFKYTRNSRWCPARSSVSAYIC